MEAESDGKMFSNVLLGLGAELEEMFRQTVRYRYLRSDVRTQTSGRSYCFHYTNSGVRNSSNLLICQRLASYKFTNLTTLLLNYC